MSNRRGSVYNLIATCQIHKACRAEDFFFFFSRLRAISFPLWSQHTPSPVLFSSCTDLRLGQIRCGPGMCLCSGSRFICGRHMFVRPRGALFKHASTQLSSLFHSRAGRPVKLITLSQICTSCPNNQSKEGPVSSRALNEIGCSPSP